MNKFTTVITVLFSNFGMVYSQGLDPYVLSPNDNQFIEIYNGVSAPNDLDFNTDETNGKDELWVINEGTENTGGSTVTLINAGKANQAAFYKKDGNSWHFMSLPTALAFGDQGEWANSPGVLDANHSSTTNPFTGPSLWASSFSIYAITPPGGNGSHLDMLHESPLAMGIAHEIDNVYWVFDGFHQTIVRYDFVDDHGPGSNWHSDGKVHFHSEISVKRDVTGVPSHMVLDKVTGWLYINDTGNKRIIRLKVGSATKKSNRTQSAGEALAENWFMENVDWEVVVSTGLNKPCGMDVFGERMVVTDNATNQIIIYNISVNPVVEVGRITVPYSNPEIRGIKVEPVTGKIWFVDHINNKVYKIENQHVTGIEKSNSLDIKLFPNPVHNELYITGIEAAEILSIKISDIMGREVIDQQNLEETSMGIKTNLSGLTEGVYVISILHESGEVISERIVKQ